MPLTAPGFALTTSAKSSGSRVQAYLVAGFGTTFQDRGLDDLRGIPGEWHIYAVAG